MTFTAPAGGSFKDAAKMDWNEVDIDELVERLTPGEIQKLLEEFDPDLVPYVPGVIRGKKWVPFHDDSGAVAPRPRDQMG